MLDNDRGIYIDLDTLLDTRFTILTYIDLNLAHSVLTDDSYYSRTYDEFGYVNNAVFKRCYNGRNKEILSNSLPTDIYKLLSSEASLLINKRLDVELIDTIELDVNTYPYRLNEQEKKDLVRSIVQYTLIGSLSVDFIYKNPMEITLSNVYSKYDSVFMYDGLKWLDYQICCRSGLALTTKLYIPSLLGKPVKFRSEKDLENTFNGMNDMYQLYMNVTTLHTELFSVKYELKDMMLSRLKST